MALLEKKKGRGKLFFEVYQLKHVLAIKEWPDYSDRLRGYIAYSSPDAARADMLKKLTEKAVDGFKPVDDDAKKVLSGLKIEKKVEPKPELPFRKDIYCYNEANGFTICTGKIVGAEMEDSGTKWMKAVKEGKLIAVELVQDDPIVMRVVAGAPLNDAESSEWVGKVESVLNLEKGEICIAGGAEHIYGGKDDAEEFSEYFHFVKVPPGCYKATVYYYVPGVNGCACLDELAGGYDQHERLGHWFKRSWPGKDFPLWLQNWCIGGAELDPDAPDEFKGRKFIPQEELPEMVHFLLHLELLPEAAKPGKMDLNGGWCSMTSKARKPEKCPVGLEGINIVGLEQAQNNGKAISKIVYPREVLKIVSDKELIAIENGPHIIDLEYVPLLLKLAVLTNPHVVPEISIELQKAGILSIDPENLDDNEAVVPLTDTCSRIMFGLDKRPEENVDQFRKLIAEFKKFPDGTVVEFAFSAALNAGSEDLDGTHRYKGVLKNAKLELTHCFPKLSSAKLAEGLELAKQVESGEIPIRDAAEGDEIVRLTLKNFPYYFDDTKPIVKGNVLVLEPASKRYFDCVGTMVLQYRHNESWPTFMDDMDDDDDDDEDEDED